MRVGHRRHTHAQRQLSAQRCRRLGSALHPPMAWRRTRTKFIRACCRARSSARLTLDLIQVGQRHAAAKPSTEEERWQQEEQRYAASWDRGALDAGTEARPPLRTRPANVEHDSLPRSRYVASMPPSWQRTVPVSSFSCVGSSSCIAFTGSLTMPIMVESQATSGRSARGFRSRWSA